MALLHTGAEQQVGVVVRPRIRDVLRRIPQRPGGVGVVVRLVDERHVLGPRQHGNPLADLLGAVARLQGDAVFAALAAPRRDEDHAVGAA